MPKQQKMWTWTLKDLLIWLMFFLVGEQQSDSTQATSNQEAPVINLEEQSPFFSHKTTPLSPQTFISRTLTKTKWCQPRTQRMLSATIKLQAQLPEADVPATRQSRSHPKTRDEGPIRDVLWTGALCIWQTAVLLTRGNGSRWDTLH